MLHLDAYNEDYLITLPSLHIEGLIYGSPFVELNKATYITSSSGYVSKIDYSGKGWLSGKKNSFTASLYPAGKEKDTIFNIDGQWTDSFTVHDGASKKNTDIDSYNAKTSRTTSLTVPALDQQDAYESRKAWAKVADAIKKSDMDTVGAEKGKIENSQRDLRKKEQAEGREWDRRFFSRVQADPLFDQLAKPIDAPVDADKTGGIWRFDAEKAKNAKPPFHPGEGP